MTIMAKFPSRCAAGPKCKRDGRIATGDPIEWERGRPVYHTFCSPLIIFAPCQPQTTGQQHAGCPVYAGTQPCQCECHMAMTAAQRAMAAETAHQEDSRARTLQAEHDRGVHNRPGGHRDCSTCADAAMVEYRATQTRSVPQPRAIPLPVGRFTVRPADETEAITISLETVSFGNFPSGTLQIAMHGAFSPKVDGERVSRSWLTFATVRPDGCLRVFSNMLMMLDSPADRLGDEDRHIQERLRRAAKAARLMLTADTDQIMAAGKAFSQSTESCFVCGRELKREKYIKLGIGPECAKGFAANYVLAANYEGGN